MAGAAGEIRTPGHSLTKGKLRGFAKFHLVSISYFKSFKITSYKLI